MPMDAMARQTALEQAAMGQTTSGSHAVTQGSQQSSSYIPEYSQTPILNEIAQYSRGMAPQVYQWGMDQYNRNAGNINNMMRSAMAYSSPQRMQFEMGQAEANVMQGAEAGRQSAIKDLESYGIDPSSGRYAALDKASRVMGAAAAAGAGNVQGAATQAKGAQMQGQAMMADLQNIQTGYGAANAANQFAGTASNLKYSPLGQISSGTNTSTSDSFSTPTMYTNPVGSPAVGQQGGTAWGQPAPNWGQYGQQGISNNQNFNRFAEGGDVDDDSTSGGFVSQELSPSSGAHVDDIDARLNAGEFVIPKDVAAWKGQEFFYKLMAQARKMRATAGQDGSGMGMQENGATEGQTGYAPEEEPGYREGGGVGPRVDAEGNAISGFARGGSVDDNRRDMSGGIPMPYLMNENQQTGKQLPYPGVRSGAAGTGAARASWMAHAAPARVGNFAGGGAVSSGTGGGVDWDQWKLHWAQNNLISPGERTGIEPATSLNFQTGEFEPNPRQGGRMVPRVGVRSGPGIIDTTTGGRV